MIKNWKKNTVYISIMQLTLLIVNFFLITIISRVYGAEIYGEYASSKSLSVLIGTAAALSIALVVTKMLAQNNPNSKELFRNAYTLIIRNLIVALVILVPISLLFNRNLSMTALFLLGFIFNEMIYIALAYYQAKGDFVTSSKQIILRTIIYGVGASVLVLQDFSIYSIIIFQVLTLITFFIVAHVSIPKKDNNFNFESENHVKDEIQGSGQKMVLTTFSSALKSELDVVLLGLFYAGPTLGVLAASLDILFPELAKAQSSKDVNDVRSKLRKVFLLSFSIPILFFIFRGFAGDIFTSLLGPQFVDVSSYTSWIIFALPVMVWSRINIIFSRALNFEIRLTKLVLFGSCASIAIYYLMHYIGFNPAILSIVISQILISILTTYSFKRSHE